MLKNIKNKDSKKQTKKEGAKKEKKEQKKVEQQIEQDESTDLVDASQLKQDQNKVKQNQRKKNDYQLEQKVIDVSNINLNKNQKPKVLTSWVSNSIEDVMREDFKMDKIDHEFVSLTDQKLNQQLLIKQKEEEEKRKNAPTIFQNNLKMQPLEKTQDQIRMQRAQGTMQFSQNTNNSQISTSIPAAKQFINSNLSDQGNFKPIQKTAQQLRMQEAERKEQEIAATQKPTSWLGGKKATQTADQKMVFKPSAWVTMGSNESSEVGNSIKFAPLNPSDLPKQPAPRQQEAPKTQAKNGWASGNIQEVNGIKFAPLQASKQEQKMKQAEGRKQQQFVFVSKKQQEQRRKKREQKQMKEKQQPKV